MSISMPSGWRFSRCGRPRRAHPLDNHVVLVGDEARVSDCARHRANIRRADQILDSIRHAGERPNRLTGSNRLVHRGGFLATNGLSKRCGIAFPRQRHDILPGNHAGRGAGWE
jgi:hypothetical protein